MSEDYSDYIIDIPGVDLSSFPKDAKFQLKNVEDEVPILIIEDLVFHGYHALSTNSVYLVPSDAKTPLNGDLIVNRKIIFKLHSGDLSKYINKK